MEETPLSKRSHESMESGSGSDDDESPEVSATVSSAEVSAPTFKTGGGLKNRSKKFNFAEERTGAGRTPYDKYSENVTTFYNFYKRSHPDSTETKLTFLASGASNEFQVASEIFEQFIMRQDPPRKDADLLRNITALRQLCIHHGLQKDQSLSKKMSAVFQERRKSLSDKEEKNELDETSLVDQRWTRLEDIKDIARWLKVEIDHHHAPYGLSMDPSVPPPPYEWTKEGRKAYYRYWQQYLLLSLYLDQPPWRLNFHKVFNCLSMPHDEILRTIPQHENYIYRNENGKPTIHLGHDKQVDFKGREERELADSVCLIIEEMERIFGPRAFLLTHYEDYSKPLGDNTKSGRVTAARLMSTIPDLKGKRSNLCVNNIRSAYATHMMEQGNMSLKDKRDLANHMRTSVGCLEKNYHKVFPKEKRQKTSATSSGAGAAPSLIEIPLMSMEEMDELDELVSSPYPSPNPQFAYDEDLEDPIPVPYTGPMHQFSLSDNPTPVLYTGSGSHPFVLKDITYNN